MFKKSNVLFLYAETSVHVGSGQALGAIDLAIQRERYTDLPVVPASGLKGSVRNWFEKRDGTNDAHILAAFGPGDEQQASDHGGAVAFTDARLLLFPMCSMKGVFAWITCPLVLERLRRDLAAAGEIVEWETPTLGKDQALGTGENANHTAGDKVLLEEYAFNFKEDYGVQHLAEWLKKYVLPRGTEYKFWQERLPTHLLVLPDDDFRHFVRHSTEVQARIKLDSDTKTTQPPKGNLFYQENLPPDTLFYSLVLAQDDLSGTLDGDGNAQELLDFVTGLDGKRLQIGGDESVGKGLTGVTFLNEPNQ